MQLCSVVDDKIRRALFSRAEKLGKLEKAQRWAGTIVPDHIRMMHIAGVYEDDARYRRLKEYLIEHAPTGRTGWPQDHSRLYTQMGDKAPFHLVPHGGGEGVEQPLNEYQKELIDRVTDELYGSYLFTGFAGTKEADLGKWEWARDTASRAAMIPRFIKIIENGTFHEALEMPRGQSHRWLALEKDIGLFSNAIARRQTNKDKDRPEQTADKDELVMIPWEHAELGAPWRHVRYRTPQCAPGIINMAGSVLVSGMIGPSKVKFARHLSHESEEGNAAKLKAWFESREKDPKKWYMLAFDVAGMEKFTSSYSGRRVLEKLDEHLGPRLGVFRLIHNAPVIAESGRKNDFLISCKSFGYTDDSLLGYGTRSGLFTVVCQNQVAADAAMLEIFESFFKKKLTVADLDGQGDSEILVLSSTDDNLLCTCNKDLVDYLLREPFVVGGQMEIEFAGHSNWPVGQAADFLATVYEIDREKGEVYAHKDMTGGLLNLFCSEAGIEFSEENKMWRRISPKGKKTLSVGTGFVLRMQSYLLNPEDGLELWEVINRGLRDVLKMHWWEAFPTTSTELLELESALEQPTAINALEWLIANRPDYLHRAGMAKEDLPEEILEAFYLSVDTTLFEQLFGTDVPTMDPGMSEKALDLNFQMPRLALFKEFLRDRIVELQKAGL